MRALEKDRDRRYQRMDEFEHDLERLLAGDSTVALREALEPAHVPAGHRLRWPLAALGVLALGVAIAVALAGGGQQATTPVRLEPATPAAIAAPAPAAAPAVHLPPATPLAPVPAASEHTRRGARPHVSRAPSAAASSGPVERGKKSKADDTVAPSPYQSDE